MNDFILVDLKPFVTNQSITIYQNGTMSCIEIPFNNVIDTVYALAQEKGIENVKIHGSNDYIVHFKDEFLVNNKFSKSLNVTLL